MQTVSDVKSRSTFRWHVRLHKPLVWLVWLKLRHCWALCFPIVECAGVPAFEQSTLLRLAAAATGTLPSDDLRGMSPAKNTPKLGHSQKTKTKKTGF
jgi:hypothetical protein